MNKERAASYLGQGVPPAQVASIMGCTPGYISQLMKEEDFKLLIAKHSEQMDGSKEKEEESLEVKAMGLQHQLMKSISDALPNAELPALVKALDVVSNVSDRIAQRKNPIKQPQSGNNILMVSLTLPQHAIAAEKPVIQLNEKNEVVSIGEKPMAPMSSDGVAAMFKTMKVKEKIEQITQLEL